jgi:hypothetical protein
MGSLFRITLLFHLNRLRSSVHVFRVESGDRIVDCTEDSFSRANSLDAQLNQIFIRKQWQICEPNNIVCLEQLMVPDKIQSFEKLLNRCASTDN